MKTLIAYYSRTGENYRNGALCILNTGNTKIIADKIYENVDADLFEIQQESPYSKSYMTCIEEAKKDLTSNARPKLKRYLDTIDSYDMIYLAYPNYWGTMPMAVWTFLEHYDFRDKMIKPLCTHEGSGLGNSVDDIRKLCPQAKVLEALAIPGGQVNEADRRLKEWIKG